jgi:hypothetical protein
MTGVDEGDFYRRLTAAVARPERRHGGRMVEGVVRERLYKAR